MKCPFCGNLNSRVIDSRSMEDGAATRRRRICENCAERFTTFERIDTIPLSVIKKDGSREIFDGIKLLNGIMKSCNKRPITMRQIEEIVSDIETTVFNTMNKEIGSREIGELVMDRLKTVDEVAYVRFASVYRQFKDVESFVDELTVLLKERNVDTDIGDK